MPRTTVGRFWAYVGIVLGLGISLAGNLAATRLGGHKPSSADLFAAGLPPVAVFVTIEVFSRNLWPDARWWRISRWLFALGVAPAAATISYIHLADLTINGQNKSLTTWSVALLTPLMIDGLLAGCTAALLIPQTARAPQRPVSAGRQAAERAAALTMAESTGAGIAFGTIGSTAPPIVKRAVQPQPAQSFGALVDRWLAEDWDDERALKEILAENPARTPAAVRAVLYRWKKTHSALTSR